MTRRFRQALYGVAIASSTFLAACGGGGGGTEVGAASTTVQPPKFACSGVNGAIDTVQTQLMGAVRPQLAAVPALGPVLQQLVTAVAQLLDVVDVLTTGLSNLAATRDPMVLNTTVEGTVASLRCSLAPVSLALAGIQANLPAGASIPSIGNANAILAQLAGLLDSGLANGPGAGLPNGINLVQVQSLMQQLTAQLNSVLSQVQGQLPAGTPVTPMLAMVTVTLVDVTSVIDRIAALDDAGLEGALRLLMQNVQSRLTPQLAGTLGVMPVDVLNSHNALTTALAQVTVLLNAGGVANILATLQGAILPLLGGLLHLG